MTPDPSRKEEMRSLTAESLRLIVQSRLVLADLETNQHRLEAMIETLDKEVRDKDA